MLAQVFFVFCPVTQSSLYLNVTKRPSEAVPHGQLCLHKEGETTLKGIGANPSSLPPVLFVPATGL